MKSNWLARATKFQNALIALQEDGHLPIFHSMLLFKGKPGEGFDEPRPRTLVPGNHVVKRIVIPLPDEWHWHHYFLGSQCRSDQADFDSFAELMHLVPGVMKGLPAAVPKFLIPQIPEGPDKSLARWLLLVSWASSLPKTHSIRSHFECIKSVASLNWSGTENYNDRVHLDEWAYGSQPVDCSFYQMLVLPKREPKGQTRPSSSKEHSGLPELIAASLKRDILFSSINAIDVLRQMLPPRSADRFARDQDESESFVKIKAFLQTYHLASEVEQYRINLKIGKVNDLPWLTQNEIAIGAGVSQPTVARLMRRVIPALPEERIEGRRLYRELCSSGNIRRRFQILKDPAAVLSKLYKEARENTCLQG